MGQNGRALLLALCATGGAVAVTGCGGPDPANASTTLHSVRQVTVVRADGDRAPGTEGMTLQRGDEVVTGARGDAVLTTQSRTVELLRRSAIRVEDGTHQSLQRGSAVVDALHGSGETVAVSGYDVAVPSGAATRLDGGVSVRVAGLAGRVRITAPGGATLKVPALSQAMLGGDTLPATTTALHLTDDAAEAAVVPALVRDDEQLNDLARGLDGSGIAAARTVDAAWLSGHAADRRVHRAAGAAHGSTVSDRVLPVVLARAGSDNRAVSAYDDAVRWRAEGGSWGVIAHLLGVGASAAADELTLLERLPRGLNRAVAAALAQAGTTARRGTATGAPVTGTGGATGSSSGPAPSPTSGGGSTPPPSPSPTPPPGSKSPVGQLAGTVDKTIRKVLKSLPSPPVSLSANIGPLHVGLG